MLSPSKYIYALCPPPFSSPCSFPLGSNGFLNRRKNVPFMLDT